MKFIKIYQLYNKLCLFVTGCSADLQFIFGSNIQTQMFVVKSISHLTSFEHIKSIFISDDPFIGYFHSFDIVI